MYLSIIISAAILFAVVNSVAITDVKVFGSLNYPEIGQMEIIKGSAPDEKVTKAVTFPEGNSTERFLIKGIEFMDDGITLPDIQLLAGGIGADFIQLALYATNYGQPIASHLTFYGEEIELSKNPTEF